MKTARCLSQNIRSPGPRFEPGTSRIRNRTTATTLGTDSCQLSLPRRFSLPTNVRCSRVFCINSQSEQVKLNLISILLTIISHGNQYKIFSNFPSKMRSLCLSFHRTYVNTKCLYWYSFVSLNSWRLRIAHDLKQQLHYLLYLISWVAVVSWYPTVLFWSCKFS
jgi:hypothetical protein